MNSGRWNRILSSARITSTCAPGTRRSELPTESLNDLIYESSKGATSHLPHESPAIVRPGYRPGANRPCVFAAVCCSEMTIGDRAPIGLRNETPLPNQSDIVVVISEVVVMEQILIRNLPAGTKAALRARAEQRHRSVEAEARDLLTRALEGEPVTIVDLLSTDEGADIEFEPERLGLTARSAEL